jgi:hypothetical protein
MSVEDRIKLILGNQMVQIVAMSAQIEELKKTVDELKASQALSDDLEPLA